MDGNITAHTLENKMLLAVFSDYLRIVFFRYLSGKCKNKSPSKLGVPLFFNFLCGIPESCAVCIFGRRVCRKHDFRINDTLLLSVILVLLVILGEQSFSALIRSSGNGRLAFASLGYGSIKVWIRHESVNLLS